MIVDQMASVIDALCLIEGWVIMCRLSVDSHWQSMVGHLWIVVGGRCTVFDGQQSGFDHQRSVVADR